jgi:S-adenosylmethionine decarboxylase
VKAFGKHYIAELSNCSNPVLHDIDLIREIITNAAVEANAEVREVALHRFSPQGISGVVVIAESHLSIHTWPEYDYAAIDIYTCGDHTDPEKACHYIADKLDAHDLKITIIKRGIEKADGTFGQEIIELPGLFHA